MTEDNVPDELIEEIDEAMKPAGTDGEAPDVQLMRMLADLDKPTMIRAIMFLQNQLSELAEALNALAVACEQSGQVVNASLFGPERNYGGDEDGTSS